MGFDATGEKPYQGNNGGPLWYGAIGLVVVLCFGGVFIAPKLLGSQTPDSEKTIAELVKGKAIPEAAGLLNAYGFQDELTHSVLEKMAQVDQVAHARLLTEMAQKAQAGTSKNDLSMMILEQGKLLVQEHKASLFKSDVTYFDQALLLASEFSSIEHSVGGNSCELTSIYKISQNQDLASKYMHYNSQYYQYAMKALLLMLNGIESGQVAPQDYGIWTVEDAAAISPLLVQMEENSAILKFFDVMKAPRSTQELEPGYELMFNGVNACEQVGALVSSFQALPVETRARFWAAGWQKPVS